MYFANGEVKEGFFENGVFKVEGTEDEIREYMKRNRIFLDYDNDDLANDNIVHSDNSNKSLDLRRRRQL